MSAHVPQQPELAAVRALRQAAASLGEPLGALSLTLAAAEQLPAVFSPALELVGFSPFGTIPDVGSTAGAQQGPGASARRKAPAAAASAGAAAGAAAGQAAGARAAQAPAPPRPAPAGGSAPPAEGFFAAVVDTAAKVATTATAVAEALVEAVAGPGSVAAAKPGAPAKPAPQAASNGPAGAIGEAVGLIGDLVGQIEDTTARAVSGVVGAPAAAPSAPIGTSILEAVTSEVGKAIQTTAGVAGPQGASVGRTIAEGISRAADVVAAPRPSLYDLLSASLLMVEVDTLAAQFGAGAPAGAASPAGRQAAPAAAAPSQAAASAATQPTNGTVVQTAVSPEPGELAWLVNEALIEQARRHGMDLS